MILIKRFYTTFLDCDNYCNSSLVKNNNTLLLTIGNLCRLDCKSLYISTTRS